MATMTWGASLKRVHGSPEVQVGGVATRTNVGSGFLQHGPDAKHTICRQDVNGIWRATGKATKK
jgi:hypothetical protein